MDKTFLLKVEERQWNKFLKTIPRDEYPSIQRALNDMIQKRIEGSL